MFWGTTPQNLSELLPPPFAKTRLLLVGLAAFRAAQLILLHVQDPTSRSPRYLMEWAALGVIVALCRPIGLWTNYHERARVGYVLWSWLGTDRAFYHTVTRNCVVPELLNGTPYSRLALGGCGNSSSLCDYNHWVVEPRIGRGQLNVLITDIAGFTREVRLETLLLMMNFIIPSVAGAGPLFLLSTWEQIDRILLGALDNTFDQRVHMPTEIFAPDEDFDD